jgi:hypothetical protein
VGGGPEFESAHLHQQGLVNDQALCFAQGSHRAVGTRWVHTSLRVQPVQAVGQVVQLLREQVAVAVQGDRRRLVAQVVLHRLDARALADQQAPQVCRRSCTRKPPAGQQPGAAGSRPALGAVTMAGRKPRPHLLDELMPAPAAEAAAERPHPLPPDPSRRVVVRIRASVADQGPGGRAAPAGPRPIHRHLGRLRRRRHPGAPRAGPGRAQPGRGLPPVTDYLRPGRRIGG